MYRKYLILIFILSCSVLFSCNPIPLKKGEKAPLFKLENLEGKKIALSSLKGKVVLLHFWTDFCKACRAEFPKIQEYYQHLKGKNFEILAINVGQPKETSKTFQKDFNVSFPMLADINGIMTDLYQVKAYPTNYFISPNGKIIRKIVGWVSHQQVADIIRLHKLN